MSNDCMKTYRWLHCTKEDQTSRSKENSEGKINLLAKFIHKF